MLKKLAVVALAAAAPALVTVPAFAAGDAAKGEKVFKKCKACHMVGENAKNRVGPPLNGVVGSKAAQAEGYNYSKPLKEADLTWDEATLDKWLEAPKDLVKGTKMVYALKKEDERADVIAYLATINEDGSTK